EKTGYPRETLELSMDMETDLGIDSIKRVDILGTMQTRFTLPRLAPEELAELRTLAQVVEHLQRAADGANAPVVLARSLPTPVPQWAVATAPATLVRLPAPDLLEASVPNGWSCVITDDGTDAAAASAAALAERGWQPVVLRLPASLVGARPALPPSVGRVDLQDLSEGQLEQALRTISESYGPVGGFIHLHPQPASLAPSNGLLSEAEQQIVKMVFLAAKQLSPALTAAGRAGRPLFMAVTRMDGELGTGMARQISPVSGGLFGLVKTLRQEWPGVFCRAVDISPDSSAAQAARLIAAESADPDARLTEVGHGPQGRVTLAADLPIGGA
ncbi:polyketide synthase, partial [Chloroflexales bacterium ZM16-3]|nr:polyketide synthase [Chloroflexales bacterium ZM16-3]